ncbi:uncharacterized protein LOC125315271 [Rhodamnia argentea]|uniref:Uncharacterized protein LOC125315271 n=1 Tax=Rhodamnia argentea TaxID=178133 RepID=A0ABM3HGI6_9MYRT|nr:uncharacterized protein LOC125315271 [Rhodamnia argentea]
MESEFGSRLDFELEDPLVSAPAKKRKKVIGLDDLLSDFYKEKGKRVAGAAKRKRVLKHDSDEEDDAREATLSHTLDQYQKQMKEMGGEDELSHWGLQVFGVQKNPPAVVLPELGSCATFQALGHSKHNSLVEVSKREESDFLEGLLVNGWLSKLITFSGHLEMALAKWTFHLLMFASEKRLRTSACDLWCDVLSGKNEGTSAPIKIDWLPTYSELERALSIYGFVFVLSDAGSVDMDSKHAGPSLNIRAWIKFVAASCQVRSKWPIFSTSEAEELTEVLICLFLDRQLEGLSMLLYECLLSVISYFTHEEWSTSCKKVAKSLASRLSMDLNCLRAVECISGIDARSKCLRSEVAYRMLVNFLDHKVADEEILTSLISINVKEKGCDLFRMYIYLVLAENWLLFNSTLEDKAVIREISRL